MVFCFWLFLYPFIPVVREMSELFLWTDDYFVERIVIPGGLAQYLGEMIGQLFINPVNGAIAHTIIFIVTWLLSSQWFRKAFPTLKGTYRFVLSLILPAVVWRLAMFPDIPLTVTMAIILVMGVGCLLMTVSHSKRWWMLLLMIPVMYWLAGPAAILLVFCCIRWIPYRSVVCCLSDRQFVSGILSTQTGSHGY